MGKCIRIEEDNFERGNSEVCWMELKWALTPTRYFSHTHTHTQIYTHTHIHQYGWCNDYRRRKWTRWHAFKSWMRLIAFHIALISFPKVLIQLFSLKLWANSRAYWFLQPWLGNQFRRRKTLNWNLLNSALKMTLFTYCLTMTLG